MARIELPEGDGRVLGDLPVPVVERLEEERLRVGAAGGLERLDRREADLHVRGLEVLRGVLRERRRRGEAPGEDDEGDARGGVHPRSLPSSPP